MNNHKVKDNHRSYFYGNTNMNLLCGNGIVGDALSKYMHSFYMSPTIPHLNTELTKLKAKNSSQRILQ